MQTAKNAKKIDRSPISYFLALLAILAVNPFVLGDPATTQSVATVSPDAAKILAKVTAAYKQLKGVELTGKITGDFDVDGQQEQKVLEFSSTYSAPNLFRLDTKDDATIGSTGDRLFAYAKNRNVYMTADLPTTRKSTGDLPEPFGGLIDTQDPSLSFALSADIADELKHGFTQIESAADQKVDGQAAHVLNLKSEDGSVVTLLVDPQTNLLRRVTTDVSPRLKKRGANEIKKATLTIEYTRATPNPTTNPTQFAWAPPPGARDAADMGGEEGADPAEALAGKPAPAFTLKDLDDKDISLAALKGNVVVLDFWATWCGPCVMSLPHLDALYKEFKDQDVKFFAVNQGEDKELVGGFMKSKNLSVPVLLDGDTKVGNKYDAHAIPMTVVVGKDGVVRKVFVGAGPDTESRLRDAIQAAMNASK